MPGLSRLALCNELFERFSFQDACRRVRALGYSGLEIAPFTLSEDPRRLSAGHRRELRQAVEDAQLEFAGLHWLLAKPSGLHVTTADERVREHSWNYVRDLVDLCADLADPEAGKKAVMVFGSPKQRSTVNGMTPQHAVKLFTDSLAGVAGHAESRGVMILVEALPANQSNVVNSLAEAVAIVREIDSPAVQTMFDTHNAVDEEEEHASLIRKYRDYIRHVHVNELDGREPGTGDYNFRAVLEALAEIDYAGWISLEVFDFTRDPEEVASRARRNLEAANLQTL